MVKKIILVPNPGLRKKSKKVQKIDKKIKILIKDMKETLLVQEDPEGVGLAAPQVGKNIRLFIMKDENKIRTVINPEVVRVEKIEKKEKQKKEGKIMEGCLSIPHHYGPIDRSKKITIKYLNEKGEKETRVFENSSAQIVQHEIDHLNGKLFIDKILSEKKPLYKVKDDEWEEVDL